MAPSARFLRLAFPLGFAAGDENLSRYVLNGPTNAIDPSGLMISDGGLTSTSLTPDEQGPSMLESTGRRSSGSPSYWDYLAPWDNPPAVDALDSVLAWGKPVAWGVAIVAGTAAGVGIAIGAPVSAGTIAGANWFAAQGAAAWAWAGSTCTWAAQGVYVRLLIPAISFAGMRPQLTQEIAEGTLEAAETYSQTGNIGQAVAVGVAQVAPEAAEESIAAGLRLGNPSRNNPVNIQTAGRPAEEEAALREYARRSNQWLDQNGSQTIQGTKGDLRREASAAARAERLRAARAGQPYSGQAGHVPDTAVTGEANPPAGWLDMPGTTNQSAGGLLGSRIGQPIDHYTVDGEVP